MVIYKGYYIMSRPDYRFDILGSDTELIKSALTSIAQAKKYIDQKLVTRASSI